MTPKKVCFPEYPKWGPLPRSDVGRCPTIVLALAQQTRPDRQTVLLSATWAPDVQQLADGVQRDPMRLMLDRGDVAANPDVKQVPVCHYMMGHRALAFDAFGRCL